MNQPAHSIARHLVDQGKSIPGATGEFTCLLWDLTIAFKIISNQVNKAGLAEIIGLTDQENIHGERLTKLDVFAHKTIFQAMDHGGHLCLMASEESREIMTIPERFTKGEYILIYDPLDGSSNIDVNVSIGSIFSILHKKSSSPDGILEDCLQPGLKQVAAGYVIYGSSTMLVYTTGQQVHGFTLDPSIGEFLLSHPNIRVPPRGSIYSVNEGSYANWTEETQKYVQFLKNGGYHSLRYIGSLVADVHRNLLKGGVFLYPTSYKDPQNPQPKLRLLYEANPIAFIVERAGGKASTGRQRILEIQPTSLHQRVPLVIGSMEEVELYEQFVQEGATSKEQQISS